MRTTVTIDDDLLAKTAELTGVHENVALLKRLKAASLDVGVALFDA
jgi:Arc/MetJ family transcription regulator